MAKIRRALISVSDKTGIVEFAREISGLGIQIISTGGTANILSEQGIPVIPIHEVTGFPEMMDGRVKTLHPNIHGGLLGLRDHGEHIRQAEEQGIQWIDLLVVNLYPFEKTVARPDVTLEEAVENIDIGGPAMLRSAAKNHSFVTVVTDPSDYAAVLGEIRETGETTLPLRRHLAVKVFRRTSDYDAAIDRFFSKAYLDEDNIRLHFSAGRTLRYGENSHQSGTFYRDPACGESSVAAAEILHGKAMSFNNYVDADAAFEAVKDIRGQIAVAVIKHTNPCGFATAETAGEALARAWEGDPISAFGSVIACNSRVDTAFAEFLKGEHVRHTGYVVQDGKLVPEPIPSKFVEVIIAPDYDPDAFALLSKTKTLRILKTSVSGAGPSEKKTYRKITGGLLEMDRDLSVLDRFEVVSQKSFDESKKALAVFTYTACKHTKSNAIVLGREYRPGFFQVIGMGAGQPNRIDSLRKLAVTKAIENLQIAYDAQGSGAGFEEFVRDAFSQMVLASDAFFPFDDTVRAAAESGVQYIVQPGGSMRDVDSVRACDELGMAMAFTGIRHFRH